MGGKLKKKFSSKISSSLFWPIFRSNIRRFQYFAPKFFLWKNLGQINWLESVDVWSKSKAFGPNQQRSQPIKMVQNSPPRGILDHFFVKERPFPQPFGQGLKSREISIYFFNLNGFFILIQNKIILHFVGYGVLPGPPPPQLGRPWEHPVGWFWSILDQNWPILIIGQFWTKNLQLSCKFLPRGL